MKSDDLKYFSLKKNLKNRRNLRIGVYHSLFKVLPEFDG